FCVALWEALCGARPYVGGSLRELHEVMSSGSRRAMPRGHAVPSWLERALERGLAIEPGERWPSMQALLDALARRPDPPRRVDVIALDPVTSNLEEAGAAVRDAAARAGFEFAYHPIHGMLESLGDDELARVAELAPGRLLINAAYTMHHTRHAVGDTEQRTRLLRRLAALEPRVLTLIEPNANHDTENIARRFHHAWNHFGAVFELIDESALDASSRFAIKEKFFGREIRDLFGVSDSFRCERHEPYESWLLRLARAGFEPAPRVELRVELPAHSSLDIADGLVRLDYRGETLIAVFAYRPSAGGSER
ncbi:MAG: hypothetical protein KC468_06480, partial [Myxococcales bacterium]|nr:hypothetical protein [Myxococcales bacterium]